MVELVKRVVATAGSDPLDRTPHRPLDSAPQQFHLENKIKIKRIIGFPFKYGSSLSLNKSMGLPFSCVVSGLLNSGLLGVPQ